MARKPGRPKKNPHSTKEDLIPHDEQQRKDMIWNLYMKNSVVYLRSLSVQSGQPRKLIEVD